MIGPCNRFRADHMGYLPCGSYGKDRVFGVFSAKTYWCQNHMAFWCRNHMVLLPVPSGPHRIIWYVYHMVPYGVQTIWSPRLYHMVPYGFCTIWFLPKKHTKHSFYHMIRRANNPYGAWGNDCRVPPYGACHA